MHFQDRRDAGRQLAAALSEYAGRSDVVVLALPRGGLPVAYEVAQALHAPLDVFVVRKLGVPGEEELALGAIATGDVRVLNPEVIHGLAIPQWQIQAVAEREQRELERRERQYRGERPPLDVHGRTVILIDDGLATGSTMRAAVAALRRQQPSAIVVAVPVGARASCHELQEQADRLVCLWAPESFFAVGQWYRHFEQTSDEEVYELLARAAQELRNESRPSSTNHQQIGSEERAMASKNDEQRERDSKRESGMPGGGQGRKDEVGRSGVYPMSGPHPPGPAEIKTEPAWGQGERGAAGYEDHGGSELTYAGGQLLGGLNTGAGGEPLAETEASSQEIPRREWITFLNQFSRQHQGWRANIEIRAGSGQRHTEVQDRPLQGISTDHLDARDRVYLEMGQTADDHLTHTVLEPRRIYFLMTRTGAHMGLEVDSQDGTRTFVRFRAPMSPEATDDVQAA